MKATLVPHSAYPGGQHFPIDADVSDWSVHVVHDGRLFVRQEDGETYVEQDVYEAVVERIGPLFTYVSNGATLSGIIVDHVLPSVSIRTKNGMQVVLSEHQALAFAKVILASVEAPRRGGGHLDAADITRAVEDVGRYPRR